MLCVNLAEHYEKQISEAALESQQDSETIQGLVKVEADYKKQLNDLRDENDLQEVTELLMKNEIE